MATPAAVLSLLVRTEGAQAATAQLRNLDSTAKSTGRSLDRSSGAAERHGKALRSIGHGAAYALGAGGFGGGMYALFDVTKRSIKEFREAEMVSRQTAAALKSTGGAAGVTAKQVDGLANAIKRKTAIDDETIASGENMLLTFTRIRNEAGKGNDIFNRATMAITDMSVAMNRGATPSAEQLTKTAILVGKALNDPIKGATALRRVGVSLTQQQQDQIKTLIAHGHQLQAQKMILRELTTEFGGSAEKQRTSAKALSVSFGDLAESIGRTLVPLGNSVLPKITSGIQRVTDVLNNPRLTPKQKLDQISKMFVAAVTKGISSAAKLAAAHAPTVAVEFVKGFVKANIWGQLAIGAFIVHRLGGWRKLFRAEGIADATAYGSTLAPTAAAEAAAAGRTSGRRFAASFRKFMVVGLAAALTVDLYNKVSGPFNDLLDHLGIGTGSAGPVAPGKHLSQAQADKLYGGRLPRNAPLGSLPGLAPIPKNMRGIPVSRTSAISAAAARYGIPAALLWGVYGTETSYGSNVNTSSAGAKGAFQFMPGTAKSYNYPYTNKQTGKIFQQQATGAAHYLADLLKQYKGNVAKALSAYSGGGYTSVPGFKGGTVGGSVGGATGAKGKDNTNVELLALDNAIKWLQRTYPGVGFLLEGKGTKNQHLHINTANHKLIRRIATTLNAMGFDVGEYGGRPIPGVGGITTLKHKHYGAADHYHGGAIDVNADQLIRFFNNKGKPGSNVFHAPSITQAEMLDFVQKRLAHYDLLLSSGLISATQLATKKANFLSGMLKGGGLTGDTRLEVMSMLRDLKIPTAAQKTWTPENKRRLAMAIIMANPGNVANLPPALLKAAGDSATLNNPWMQAFQTNLTNQVGSGALTQGQADQALAKVLTNALPYLIGQDAADARSKLFEIATNTKETARAALDTANSVRASGISDAQFLGGLSGPAKDAVMASLAAFGIVTLPGGGNISEIGNSAAAVGLAQSDIAALMAEVNAGQVAFADIWPQLLNDLQVIASGATESADASNAATEAVNALTAELKKNTDFAQSVTATELGQSLRAMADFVNGQIYGNYGQRSSTASAGSVRRY